MRIVLILTCMLYVMPTWAHISALQADSIIIKYCPWSLETDINVTCSSFEQCLDYKAFFVQDSVQIDSLLLEFRKLIVCDKKYEDFRCKMELFKFGEIRHTICIGTRYTKIDDNYYYTSESLMTAIDSIIKNKTPLFKQPIMNFINENNDSIKNYLVKQAERISKSLGNQRELRFIVFCKVASSGKTVDAKFSRDPFKNELPIKLVNELKDILYNEIRWNTNKSDYNTEKWISIGFDITN